jgi:membrane-bound ClpP family serine protease
MLGTLISTAIALFFSFRSGAWRKFSLKDAITSKVNEGMTASLAIGEEGITISSLRPSGKAQFNNAIFEVRTRGLYLEPKTKVKIISIDLHQILVEPVNP